MRYDIWATVQDPGEMANMVPVVKLLRDMGLSVRLLAAGSALAALKEKGCEYWDATDPKAIAQSEEAPRLLLATTAYQGGAGRDLIPLLRGKSKSVLLQSMWGGLAGWGQEHVPDYVITNDYVGQRMVTALWPALASASVYKTGFPMLDQYAGFDVIAERAKARHMLKLGDNKPLVVFAGQSDATGAMLAELVEVLDTYRDRIHFAPRPHPRMMRDYPSEAARWDKAVAAYRGRVVDTSQCSMMQLVAAAWPYGAVASMYSTTLLEAAAARTTAIAMLYPEALAAFRKENPGLEQFPLAELGCSWHAPDRASLEYAVSTALTRSNVLRPQQMQHIVVDGQNARRAADVVIGLLQ